MLEGKIEMLDQDCAEPVYNDIVCKSLARSGNIMEEQMKKKKKKIR